MGGNHKPPPEPEVTGLEDGTVSNSQEAVPVAMLAGERPVPLVWISRIYNQKTKPAPVERPGKKG